MTVAQIRIARPTGKLAEIVRFYRDGLGLKTIAEFHDHAGYDGVMLALPDRQDHLEFTSSRKGSPCPAPTLDNLLVFYIPDSYDFYAAAARLKVIGCEPVAPENPYWLERGALTFEDPDGWRVVLFHGDGIQRIS